MEHVVVIRCQGRIVSGDEIRALHREVDDSLLAKKRIVLNLAEVNFIDSAGLGFLVRIFSRLSNDGGGLKLCQISPVVLKALQVTNLHAVIPSYESERHAVEAFYYLQRQEHKSPGTPITKVVCVDDSFDLLAYLNALLTHAGYEVFPTRHVNDARMLVSAVRPRVLIMGPTGRASDALIERMRHSVPDLHVIALASDFSTDDPAHSSTELIRRVQSLVTGAQAQAGS
jgi:anti-anti-sigma factor